MARYRLKSAHYLAGDKWLPGDAENQHLGDERGTIVGDGTDHEVKWPTLEMDQYEQNYVPGLNVRRKKPAADGAPVREKTNA
jgi:hypothetical protein